MAEITLRQYYAGKIIAAIIARDTSNRMSDEQMILKAFAMADQMIEKETTFPKVEFK